MGIFDVAAVWLIIWLVRNAAVDMVCAVKGRPVPTHERWKIKHQGVVRKSDWGVRTYLENLVRDGLKAQTERRRMKTSEKNVEPAEGKTPQASDMSETGRNPAAQNIPTSRARVAPVLHLFRDKKENPEMINGEVVGLDQSIAYADQMATELESHGPAGNEDYISGLVLGKVIGQALEGAHLAQDLTAQAAEAWRAHQRDLEDQKAVQEAYDMAPDAGDKEFVQAGR